MDLQKKWDGVWKMKFIQQYKNLSKEIYILFFGRVVTSMGSLIWPLLTLILKNKLGYPGQRLEGTGQRDGTHFAGGSVGNCISVYTVPPFSFSRIR